MENKKVSEKKDSWLKVLLSYTEGSGQRLGISVILSVISTIFFILSRFQKKEYPIAPFALVAYVILLIFAKGGA